MRNPYKLYTTYEHRTLLLVTTVWIPPVFDKFHGIILQGKEFFYDYFIISQNKYF